MPTVPAAHRTAAPPAPQAVAIVPARAPVALTARGVAALRLADFRDQWAALTPADRAWFAEDLRDLLVDAVMGTTDTQLNGLKPMSAPA